MHVNPGRSFVVIMYATPRAANPGIQPAWSHMAPDMGEQANRVAAWSQSCTMSSDGEREMWMGKLLPFSRWLDIIVIPHFPRLVRSQINGSCWCDFDVSASRTLEPVLIFEGSSLSKFSIGLHLVTLRSEHPQLAQFHNISNMLHHAAGKGPSLRGAEHAQVLRQCGPKSLDGSSLSSIKAHICRKDVNLLKAMKFWEIRWVLGNCSPSWACMDNTTR